MRRITTLGRLPPGSEGIILSVGSPGQSEVQNSELIRRLLQMGLVEGEAFELAFDAPWSRDPIAVKVRGAIIALRRSEADLIQVQLNGEPGS